MSRSLDGYKFMEIETGSLEEMLLEAGNICIVNPKNEEPHIDVSTKKMVHFQHGDTKVVGDDISVAFVFRVTPHIYSCNIQDNRVMLPEELLKYIREKELNSKVDQSKRNEKYDEFDKVEYHKVLKAHFDQNYNI